MVNIQVEHNCSFFMFKIILYSIKEADVLYKKEKLTTKDDFDKYLGRGETTKDDYFTYITYKEDNLSLRLSILDGELYNIEITQDK